CMKHWMLHLENANSGLEQRRIEVAAGDPGERHIRFSGREDAHVYPTPGRLHERIDQPLRRHKIRGHEETLRFRRPQRMLEREIEILLTMSPVEGENLSRHSVGKWSGPLAER